MDRFIAAVLVLRAYLKRYLKSNMDRFIDYEKNENIIQDETFKIQYG